MTEGVEEHHPQQTKHNNDHRKLQRRDSGDVATYSITCSRTYSLQTIKSEPGLKKMVSCESEEQDQQEEGSASFPEVQHHFTEGAEDGAPDGGWGWVVLAATFLVMALTLAFPSCIGIFYTDLQNDFSASNTEMSWVPAIMTAMVHAGGRENIVTQLLRQVSHSRNSD